MKETHSVLQCVRLLINENIDQLVMLIKRPQAIDIYVPRQASIPTQVCLDSVLAHDSALGFPELLDFVACGLFNDRPAPVFSVVQNGIVSRTDRSIAQNPLADPMLRAAGKAAATK